CCSPRRAEHGSAPWAAPASRTSSPLRSGCSGSSSSPRRPSGKRLSPEVRRLSRTYARWAPNVPPVSKACRCRPGLQDASSLQAVVDKADRHGAFAGSRGQALDRPAAHVAGREDTRAAGLEEERRAAVAFRGGSSCPTRQDEAMVVESKLAVQPRRLRLGADEDEERAHGQPCPLAG